MVAPKRKIFAVISLFLVAPLVAEYLLGDLPLKLLSALIVLAPAYGGGALLIRETARRTGRGWPTMLMLGAAYTLIGEGLVSQSLFNPDYMQKHWHLLYPAYLFTGKPAYHRRQGGQPVNTFHCPHHSRGVPR